MKLGCVPLIDRLVFTQTPETSYSVSGVYRLYRGIVKSIEGFKK